MMNGNEQPVDWGKVDWNLQDVVIAELVGRSKERVRQMRPAGVKAKSHRQKRGDTALGKIRGMDTAGMTAAEVAGVVGCKTQHARLMMRRLKKPYRLEPKWNAKYDWAKLPANWQDVTDKVMAGIVGASSPAVVTQWRVRHGMRKRGGG